MPNISSSPKADVSHEPANVCTALAVNVRYRQTVCKAGGVLPVLLCKVQLESNPLINCASLDEHIPDWQQELKPALYTVHMHACITLASSSCATGC